ncbi:MAG: phosphoribosylglycinamide formyltransferase [Halofilum sp. (in: g-proteobacteria)]
MSAPLPVVALVSGRGTNLQALLDEAGAGRLPVEFRAVISNRPDALGLERATAAGIQTEVVDHRAFTERADFDAALAASIDAHTPALIVLAGFMRIFTDAFVERYRARMLNIHPSLLPDFRGLDTHQRALDAGVARHGATVHFVTPELDGGPPVAQVSVPVHADDDADTLAARVLDREHRLYPLVVRWLAEGRLRFDGHTPYLDGRALTQPLLDPPELTDVAA